MLGNETAVQGVDDTKGAETAAMNNQSASKTDDPFASQRTDDDANAFSGNGVDKADGTPASPSSPNDRRASSDEWDASKTPPSRFQQRKGSIYATPSSRDGHVGRNFDRDSKFHDKHAEKGYGSKRRESKPE